MLIVLNNTIESDIWERTKQIPQRIDISRQSYDIFSQKLRQLKSNDSCISEAILMNIHVHHPKFIDI